MIEQVVITVKSLIVEQMEVVQKVDVYVQNTPKVVNTAHFVNAEIDTTKSMHNP